jgi:sec-independent protein translocase protein TatA
VQKPIDNDELGDAMRALFDSPAAIILLLLVIVLFGAKRLPDAAKSVGKSIKIFKSEMESDKETETKDLP